MCRSRPFIATLRASAPEELDAGWSSPVARQAHNLKVIGSNPIPAPIGPQIDGAPRSTAPSRGPFPFVAWLIWPAGARGPAGVGAADGGGQRPGAQLRHQARCSVPFSPATRWCGAAPMRSRMARPCSQRQNGGLETGIGDSRETRLGARKRRSAARRGDATASATATEAARPGRYWRRSFRSRGRCSSR